ncbi:VOC family protein [Nitrosopumilus sp.]|uniref:VOC family protein n=1 Tax=Nitrosopumilus sp. TaxID=2024843 RepID=UPI00292F9F3B|nr:VOC family protein [Nitrosopumilus sp.]
MNKVVWFEIPFDESERAQKFYKDVFGWQINHFPEMDYYVATTDDSDPQTMEPKQPGAINGGLMKKDDTAKHPVILVEVPSIDEHLKKIEQNGGKTVMPKINAGNLGLYARVSDTEGNVIGLWEKVTPK